MAGSNPALIVRVAATIEDLKKNFGEVKAETQATAAAVAQLGGAPTAGMQRLAAATEAVVIPADRLRGSLRQFDAILSQLGFNISGETNALTEMAEASGKTVGQLGLVTTAGLAIGAGMAGWKIGRAVADFFDLDEKIGNATAKLLGWGDVAGEVAGAKQDTINAAIRRGADATISYADAIQFNTKKVQEQQAALKEQEQAEKDSAAAAAKAAAEQARWGAVMDELNTAGATWRNTLQGMDGEVVAAVQFYLQAGVAQGTLATAYGLTATQVKAVATGLQEETEAAKAATAAAEKAAVASAHWADIMAQLTAAGIGWQGTLDTIDGTVVEAVKFYLDAGVAQNTLAEAYGLTAEQIQAVKSATDAETASTQANTAATQQNTQAKATQTKSNQARAQEVYRFDIPDLAITDENKASFIARLKQIRALYAAFPGRQSGVNGPTGLNSNDARGWSEMLNEQIEFAALTKALPGYQRGVLNAPGGLALVGERGPELVSLPRGANVYPHGSGAGAGTVINLGGIHVHQPLGTPTAIAAAVDEALMKRLRDTGVRF